MFRVRVKVNHVLEIENYTRLTWKLKFDCNSITHNTASRDHMRLHHACIKRSNNIMWDRAI